jgi:hypothetical protein
VNDDPTNPDPNVRLDRGQWISGPCYEPDDEIPRLDMPMTGALLADLYPDWEISRDEVFGVWQAERRRGSEVHFLAAVEAWELGLKIKAAGQAEQ